MKLAKLYLVLFANIFALIFSEETSVDTGLLESENDTLDLENVEEISDYDFQDFDDFEASEPFGDYFEEAEIPTRDLEETETVDEDTPIDFPFDTVVYAPGYGYKNQNQALKASQMVAKPTKNPLQFPSATSKFVRFLGHFWAIIGPWLALLSWHVCPSFGDFGNLGLPFCVLAVPALSVSFLRFAPDYGTGAGSGSGSGPSATGMGETGPAEDMMRSTTTRRPGGRRPCPPGTPNARPGQFCIGNRPIPG